MRYHNFWCISFVSIKFFKYVQKTPKSWEKVCSTTVYNLSSKPEKTLLQAWKPLKIDFFLPTSFSDNNGQKSWDTFAFLGCFPIHTSPTPPLTPQTTLDVIYQKLMLRVSSGVPNTKKQMKAAECFYCIVSFPNETKKYAVIHFFAIVLPNWKNTNLKHCVNMHD